MHRGIAVAYVRDSVRNQKGKPMKHGYQCEGCKQFSSTAPWICPGCGCEICDGCFDRYMLCKKCTKGLSDAQAKEKIESFGIKWEEDNQ